MVDYDLAIVGSGGAAFGAAIEARRRDARVVMIEDATVGGTCVNVGCIPSKTLLVAAASRHTAASHPFAGVPTSAGPVDLAALTGQKDDLVAGMRQHKYLDLAELYGFEIVAGHARFNDTATLTVDGHELSARAYVVASGTEPTIPPLPGLAEAGFLTSTTAMEHTSLPERLVTIGGGFVGAELSQLYARLGTRVTIIGRLAPRAEPELASRLRLILMDEGIQVVNARATAVEARGAAKVVRTDRGGSVDGDTVLVAAGRHARLDGLDPQAADVGVDEAGFVTVDASLRTTNPRIFAAGDVTGGPQFVYVAAAQGHLAATNALAGSEDTIDYTGLPSVVFTDPQLASAGLSEAQAVAAGYDCDCRVLGLDNVPRALVEHDTRGAIKLVADRQTGEVLGVHALAAGAGDLVLAGVYAIKFGLTVDALASTWAPYLTMSEALRLAAQSFTRPVDHLSCCAA
ncbi:MAG: mercury(II) reductase [Acidimicrobiales bacterium]